MKPLHKHIKKAVAKHAKIFVKHKKAIHKAAVKHHRKITRAIQREINFSLLLVSIGIIVLMSGLGLTGNFTLENQPEVFVGPTDHVYVWLSGNDQTPLVLISPDQKTMKISSTQIGLVNVVAKVSLDGQILEIKRASNCQLLDSSYAKIEGSLLGAAVDGTWKIKNTIHFGLPAGVRLSVGGKILNDVDTSNGHINSCNQVTSNTGGSRAGNALQEKIWNWHEQSVFTVYQTSTVSALSPIENLLYAKYFTSESLPEFSTGQSGTTSVYPDDFNADLTPPTANSNVFGLIDSNYYWATAPTRWVQYSPASVFYQKNGRMNALSPPTQLSSTHSLLILEGYTWDKYNARYNTFGYSEGGFVVRFSDSLNFLAILPKKSGIEIIKVKSGIRVDASDIRIISEDNSYTGDGLYVIDTLESPYMYSVKYNGKTLVVFEDTKADFTNGRVGFYFRPSNTLTLPVTEGHWDNFRISQKV